MKIEALHVGLRVAHPQLGTGTVKGVSEHTAVVEFDAGGRREVSPETSGLAPAEAQATVTGLSQSLPSLIRQVTEATLDALGVERAGAASGALAARWRGGKMVLHPVDPTLQTKEVELDVFFHKIVMVRNQLRVLEQKINASEVLTSAEKLDWQQYITRCYGSLTTFNVLFREKEDQF